MRLDLTPYYRLMKAMQVYHSKMTREDKPAPEIRWNIGKDVQIIGFDDFKCQIRLSVARLNGKDCHVLGDDSTAFFTEVPAVGHLGDVVGNTEVIIDTKSSQNHLLVYTEDFEYRIRKIPYSEPLEFRQRYLPMKEFIAEGSIQREKLYQCINLSPDETLRIEIAEGNIRFVSASIDEKVEWILSDVTISSETIPSTYSFSVEFLSDIIKDIPKNKRVQFSITEEFIRFRYKLGDIGYMNYYQRNKNSGDVYVI